MGHAAKPGLSQILLEKEQRGGDTLHFTQNCYSDQATRF